MRSGREAKARGACAPSSVALVACLGSMLASGGCQSMTELKMENTRKELLDTIDKVRTEWQAILSEEEKKSAEENARLERADKSRTALDQLEAGDAKGALLVVEGVLHQPVPPSPAGTDAGAAAPSVPELEPAEKATFLSLKGVALSELGRRDDGITELRAALQLDPSNRHARRNLGRLLLEMGKYREALTALEPELADGWRDAQLLSLVGRARHEVGRAGGSPQEIEAARFAFQQIIIAEPENMEAVRSLAAIEYETERYGEAMRSLNALRRENPLDPEVLEKLGRCHLALGDQQRALDYLELAASLRPPPQELSVTIAGLHERLGYPGKAAEWLDRAYRNTPEEAPPAERRRAGALFFAAGRPEDALTWLSAVGEGDPQYTDCQAMLVRIYAAAGRDADALSAYEKLKGLPLQNGATHVAAGLLYLRGRQLEKAAEAYARASSLARTKVEGLSGLAEVLVARGDAAGALEAYRKVLDLRPADTRALTAMESLGREADRLARNRSAPPEAAPR